MTDCGYEESKDWVSVGKNRLQRRETIFRNRMPRLLGPPMVASARAQRLVNLRGFAYIRAQSDRVECRKEGAEGRCHHAGE